MPVNCERCKKPIESKQDLLVMCQWGVLPRPMHRACWANTFTQFGGAGSIAYGTGVFQGGRRNSLLHIPINSMLYTVIAVIASIVGVFILASDFSTGTFTVNGQQQPIDPMFALGVKLLFFFLLNIPIIQRLWSYFKYESTL